MAKYEITDSVLKRHHEQHLAAGGAPVASSFTRDKAQSDGTSDTNIQGMVSSATTASAAENAASADSGIPWGKVIPIVLALVLVWLLLKYMF